MHIVIIDDEMSSLNTFLFNIVDTFDIRYVMFKDNPIGALDYLATHDVDAVFLDINMPKIDGLELAEMCINVKPSIKIVFITGYEKDEDAIAAKLGSALLGFCHKPYEVATLNKFLAAVRNSAATPSVYLRTFPTFELIVNNATVSFTRAKSKELLALLTDRQGATVGIDDAVACLWGDKSSDLSKRLYRDAVSRLRLVLADNDIPDLVRFGRGSVALNCTEVQCDLWSYLADDNSTLFCGEYLINYEWSTEKQYYLQTISDRRRGK